MRLRVSSRSPLRSDEKLLIRTVLKLYGISSLDPDSWEDVDHDKEGPLAGTLMTQDGGIAEENDPLGLRGRLSKYVLLYTTLRSGY